MDAVVLANYANEHVPFAIKAMKRGLHVFSEVLPCQNMKEAVELIETVEDTGLVYAYGENYCYMPAPFEMKRLYKQGKIGEFEYGECEYIHNCAPIWHSITYGERDHWRNNMYSTFYCTHSLGPIIHATGLRPVSVTGFEGTKNERNLCTGAKSGQFGMEMVTLENGGIIKSIHGNLYKNSVWYSMYGAKGRMESAREDAQNGGVKRIYVNCDEHAGEYAKKDPETYEPTYDVLADTKGYGHGGSDFYSMYFFVEKILGNKDADTIDVYEAMDMFLPGMFAYRSILKGGIPMEIPNLRDKAIREQWRNDTACTDPKAAGDMLLPCRFPDGQKNI
jgi:predicted dehydrogenase